MDRHLLATSALTVLASLGVLLVALLPVWIAWWFAWRSKMPRTCRRSFALACLLLAYGVMTLVGAALSPLGVFQVFMAADLHHAGHEALANAIFVGADYGASILPPLAGCIAAFVIPLRLHRHWIAIVGAIASPRASGPIHRAPPD